MAERAGIFDGAAEFDVDGFTAKKRVTSTGEAAAPEAIRAVSEASSFRSREPSTPKSKVLAKREPRRHRTGRNVQINLKACAEVVEAFYAIADSQKWVLGETLERAVSALQRELDEDKSPTK